MYLCSATDWMTTNLTRLILVAANKSIYGGTCQRAD